MSMSMSVNINPSNQTVRATRNLRKSGDSTVLTIPPEVLQSLDLEPTDTLEIEGDWGEGEIRLRKVE